MANGLVALFFCLTTLGCADQGNQASASVYAGCVAPVARDAAGVLTVCGQLNESTAQAALAQIQPSDREIVLTSGGGHPGPAMRLAETIRAQHLTVRVKGFCLSACSTYVLLTADRVFVEPDTVVAFHHTGAFAYDMVAARTNAPATHSIWAQAGREREFFRSADLSADLLDRIALAVEPTCMGVRANGSGREMALTYRWSWFVPDPDAAQAMFGDRLSGYWPKSAAEAETLLRRLGILPGPVRYGGLPTAVDPVSFAATLPECPPA